MPDEPKDYFRLQKVVLKASGISLYENDSFWYKAYFICIVVIVVGFYTIMESHVVYAFMDDMDVLASILTLFVTHILGALKVFVLLKNKNNIQKTLSNLEEGIFKPNSERGGRDFEKNLIVECIKTTQKQSFMYYAPTVIVWFFIVIRTVATRIMYDDYKKWQTPAIPFALFELKKSPDFELISLFQGACVTFFATIISSTDLLIVGVIAHIKTQLMLLRNSILRIVEDAANSALKDGFSVDPSDPASIPPNYLQFYLGKVVVYHQAIFDLADEFEEQFNFLILTIFLANTAILCFAMYHASLYPIGNDHSIQDFAFIFTIATQVFLYCYWGNELTLESQSVASTCWESNFVGASVSFQRSLVIMMHRSQKPIVITAGKFTNLSLMTFVGVRGAETGSLIKSYVVGAVYFLTYLLIRSLLK